MATATKTETTTLVLSKNEADCLRKLFYVAGSVWTAFPSEVETAEGIRRALKELVAPF